MRFRKVPLILLALLLVTASTGMAQYIGCDDLVKSNTGLVRMPNITQVLPGSTFTLPVTITNDSAITAFQLLIDYNPDKIRPIFYQDSFCIEVDSITSECTLYEVDSSFVEFEILSDRFLITDTLNLFPLETDTITKFQSTLFQGRDSVVACNFFPDFADFDTIYGGSDEVFGLKFEVLSGMVAGDTVRLRFFESDVCYEVIDPETQLLETVCVDGCWESSWNSTWYNSESEPVEYLVYPNSYGTFGYYLIEVVNEINEEAEITSFTAVPSQILPSGTSNLSWSSTSADSVVITEGSTRLSSTSNGSPNGSIQLSSLSVGTHTYTATAYSSNAAQDSRNTSVLVTEETTDGPTVTVTGQQSDYDQGDMIQFTVRAENDGSSNITISSTSLPAGATFGSSGSVSGSTPVIGTFTWTPSLAQEGLFTVRFSATDDGGTTNRDVSFQVNAIEFDRLFSSSTLDNRPVGGLPGREAIAFPIDLVATQTVYGVQFDMLYPYDVMRIDSFAVTDRTPEYVIYDNVGVTPGEIRVLTFGLDNEPVIDGTSTAVLQAYLTLDSAAVPGDDYTIYLEDGREAVSPDPEIGSVPLVTDSGVVQVDILGDVNLDRYIDVADLVNIVAFVIGNYDLSPRQFEVADVISNDSVNVFDLVGDINLIYGIPVDPTPTPAPVDDAYIEVAFNDLYQGTADVMTVRSEIPTAVAGVQIEVNYDPFSVDLGKPEKTIEVDNHGYLLNYNDDGNGHMIVLLHSMKPFDDRELLQSGAFDLVDIPVTPLRDISAEDQSRVRITKALMSTGSAASVNVQGVAPPIPDDFSLSQNYPNPFNPSTQIEFSIGIYEGGGQQVTLDVFNVLGQKVRNLVDDYLPVGEYTATWDATDDRGRRVATGVYLYRLRVGDNAQTKKMLFLK